MPYDNPDKTPFQNLQEFKQNNVSDEELREMLHEMPQDRLGNYVNDIHNQMTIWKRSDKKESLMYEQWEAIIKGEDNYRKSLPNIPDLCNSISIELEKKYGKECKEINSPKAGTKEFAVKELNELITNYKKNPANDEQTVKDRLEELSAHCEVVMKAANKAHNKGANKLAHSMFVGKAESDVSVAMQSAVKAIQSEQKQMNLKEEFKQRPHK